MAIWNPPGKKAVAKTVTAAYLSIMTLLLFFPSVAQALPSLDIVEFRFGIPWIPISPHVYDGSMEVRIANTSTTDEALNVSATLSSLPYQMMRIDGFVSFGDITAASSKWSFDTFSVRWDTSFPLQPSDTFTWSIIYWFGGEQYELTVNRGPSVPTIPAVPEPASLILLSAGLCGVVCLRNRRQR